MHIALCTPQSLCNFAVASTLGSFFKNLEKSRTEFQNIKNFFLWEHLSKVGNSLFLRRENFKFVLFTLLFHFLCPKQMSEFPTLYLRLIDENMSVENPFKNPFDFCAIMLFGANIVLARAADPPGHSWVKLTEDLLVWGPGPAGGQEANARIIEQATLLSSHQQLS